MVVVFEILNCVHKYGEIFSAEKLNNIFTIMVGLATISIAIFQIVLSKIDEHILGISFKGIFMNQSIWKYLNFSNSSFLLIEALVIYSMLEYLNPASVNAKHIICIILLLDVIINIIMPLNEIVRGRRSEKKENKIKVIYKKVGLETILRTCIEIIILIYCFRNEPDIFYLIYLVQFSCFVGVIFYSCWILYLGLIAIHKNSKIYSRIMKQLKGKKSYMTSDTYKRIIDVTLNKAQLFIKKNTYNQYLFEDIGCLVYMYKYNDDLIIIDEQGETVEGIESIESSIKSHNKEILINIIKEVIQADIRDNEELLTKLKKRGNAQFGENDKVWKEVLEKINSEERTVNYIPLPNYSSTS
ncbi:MAG: hypothetical protein Q4F05_10290 [bacterium]|nr:hypothetical protein [bacterium]